MQWRHQHQNLEGAKGGGKKNLGGGECEKMLTKRTQIWYFYANQIVSNFNTFVFILEANWKAKKKKKMGVGKCPHGHPPPHGAANVLAPWCVIFKRYAQIKKKPLVRQMFNKIGNILCDSILCWNSYFWWVSAGLYSLYLDPNIWPKKLGGAVGRPFFFLLFLNLDREKIQYHSCLCILGHAEPQNCFNPGVRGGLYQHNWLKCIFGTVTTYIDILF